MAKLTLSKDLHDAEMKLQEENKTPGLRRNVWDQHEQTIKYPKLEYNISADVVVVGGGIAGLSVAYHLVKAGKSVVVLEAKCIGHGQSGKTTGHLMPWNDDYYHVVEKAFGTEKAILVAESHRGAIDWVENVIKEEGIDCNFKRLDGYLFASDERDITLTKLIKEYEASRRLGFTDTRLLEFGEKPLAKGIRKAIQWANAAELHPLMYLNGLARAIVKRGGKIYEDSPMRKKSGATVYTKSGYVEAHALVLATHCPIHRNPLVHARQKPDRTYMIGLKVNKGDIEGALWWDTESAYHSVRLVEKSDHDVLLVGGENHRSGIRPDSYVNAWLKLENWARTKWPAAKEVVYQWTGQAYKPIDFLGLYGRDPGNLTNTYIATGDSGQVLTGATIAGIVISSQILGRTHPWTEVYNPSRIPPINLSTIRNELEEVQNNLQGYAYYVPFVGTDKVDIEDLAPGCGAVIQQAGVKIAAYRDERGILHRYTAICPHLGCVVQWNPNDATFDCPCHGSQFDSFGRVINGPSDANLIPI